MDYITEILSATPDSTAKAARLLQCGELVAFPTETVYGLGADAQNTRAVEKIFQAKRRPADNPLIVHVTAKEQVLSVAKTVSKMAQLLMDRFWPGPLTLILPALDRVPSVVTGGLRTVGIRMPDHPVALALIHAAGFPIAAPSANASGRPSPTTARHVYQDLTGRIPLILDGGPCQVGLESTVLDVTGEIPIVLRPGAVTPEMIREVAGAVRVHPSALSPLASDDQAASPGMKYRHYAPNCEVVLYRGMHAFEMMCARYDQEKQTSGGTVLIAPMERSEMAGERSFLPLGSSLDAQSAARSLFAVLRGAETMGARLALVEGIDPEGVGLAVMNRLYRAAGFHVEE